ncbi:LOW QUALITY PROTEIN: uncharacterized protein At4g13200, chloroplastic [Prunus avium]|uniref:LOW QUALITY PROTEIN: uncharacterized protein At4g13200, chloroplastic n=1 Tax=Prunus avium TaxID=42229 RepID=A0A6P5TU92_PRUAV|nr:LOW QUALITY PROTEIN: uncharacterized protein At4g13200, chloroplastic [Prunus avium]
MISGVLASASPQAVSFLLSKPRTSCCCYASSSVSVTSHAHQISKLQSFGFFGTKGSQRSRVQCNSSTGPGGPGSGDGDSRSVLDAFFLGKALAEAINERIESSVGEFLSTIGRLQAEQQKQVEEFREDVLERAKKAKEKAAREAAEVQGLAKPPTAEYITPVTITNGVTQVTSTTTTTTSNATPVNQSSLSEPAPPATANEPGPADEDTIFGVPLEE